MEKARDSERRWRGWWDGEDAVSRTDERVIRVDLFLVRRSPLREETLHTSFLASPFARGYSAWPYEEVWILWMTLSKKKGVDEEGNTAWRGKMGVGVSLLCCRVV